MPNNKVEMQDTRIMNLACDCKSYENLPLPDFANPIEIGYFSIQADDTSAFDRSQLKTLCLPPDVPLRLIASSSDSPGSDLLLLNRGWASSINLTDGFAFNPSLKENDGVKVYINPLLRWILHNREQIIASPRLVQTPPTLFQCCSNAEFVCSRSVLKEVARTAYRPNDGWTLNVLRWQNVYFLVKMERTEWRFKKPSDEDTARYEFCGPRFEQLSTKIKDCIGARVTSSCAQYCSVVKAKFQCADKCNTPHHFLCAGEIDCENSSGVYTELKLRPRLQTQDDVDRFAWKLVDVWLQCLFIGVPKVVIGFRDDSFHLHSIAEMNTGDIPAVAASIHSCRSPWKPAAGLNFFERFLTQLKTEISSDDLNTVYEIKYIPKRFSIGINSGFQSGVQIRRLNEAEFAKDKSFKFFRDSFVKHFTAA